MTKRGVGINNLDMLTTPERILKNGEDSKFYVMWVFFFKPQLKKKSQGGYGELSSVSKWNLLEGSDWPLEV